MKGQLFFFFVLFLTCGMKWVILYVCVCVLMGLINSTGLKLSSFFHVK